MLVHVFFRVVGPKSFLAAALDTCMLLAKVLRQLRVVRDSTDDRRHAQCRHMGVDIKAMMWRE